jgi:DNA-nicking Smr family endonuclease
MNDSDSPLKHNPFEGLKKLLKDKPVLCPELPKEPQKEPTENDTPPVDEKSAFQEAMVGVRPMARDHHHARKNQAAPPPDPLPALTDDSEQQVLQQLHNLVTYGEGFIISQTPEYMEGTGRDIPAELAERLHRGDFSIQEHLDLHGLNAVQAREAFESFLQKALRSGKQGVLIIHGRGISSAGEPVLKNKVCQWLTRSRWRKWVIAFTSAQAYDGGAGATYVLLRRRLKRPPKH